MSCTEGSHSRWRPCRCLYPLRVPICESAFKPENNVVLSVACDKEYVRIFMSVKAIDKQDKNCLRTAWVKEAHFGLWRYRDGRKWKLLHFDEK